MKILVALYMKFICPAVAQPPYSTWDKVIVLGASTTYALKLKSSSKYIGTTPNRRRDEKVAAKNDKGITYWNDVLNSVALILPSMRSSNKFVVQPNVLPKFRPLHM